MILIETNRSSNSADLSLTAWLGGGDMEWKYLVNSHQGFSTTKSQLTRTRPTAFGVSQVVGHSRLLCLKIICVAEELITEAMEINQFWEIWE